MAELVNELAGKVAIVTGSARNIGRATAEELARAGASLVINAVQAEDLCTEVAAGIRAAGGQAIPVMADCSDPDDIERLAQAAIAEFGGIKGSGYGRESGFQAMYDYTRPKTVWVNTSDEPMANPFVMR